MKSIIDAKQLKAMRKNAGLSQWQVAKAVQRTQGYISTIEMGYVVPTQKVLAEIATAINSLNSKLNSTND